MSAPRACAFGVSSIKKKKVLASLPTKRSEYLLLAVVVAVNTSKEHKRLTGGSRGCYRVLHIFPAL